MNELVIGIIAMILTIAVVTAVVVVVLNQYSPFKICADRNWTGNYTWQNQKFDCEVLKDINVSLGGVGK